RDILADGLRADEALQAAVLRHIGDAEIARRLRRADRDRLAVEENLAGGRRRDAEDGEGELRPPGADEAGNAEDLAGMKRQRDVVHDVAMRDVAEFEERSPDLHLHLREELVDRA